MRIPLVELALQLPVVGLLTIVLFILVRSLFLRLEWLPLLWEGRWALRDVRSDSDPLDVDIGKLPPRGLARRLDEWSGEARSGRTRLGFDDWLVSVASPGRAATAGIKLHQNELMFLLRHGRRYVITDEHRGIRAFECRIDGQLPIVAFIDAVGNRGPWLTLQRLFTIEEIVSLRPWNGG